MILSSLSSVSPRPLRSNSLIISSFLKVKHHIEYRCDQVRDKCTTLWIKFDVSNCDKHSKLQQPKNLCMPRYTLNWIRGIFERMANRVLYGYKKLLCHWSLEIARLYQNSVFQKCEPAVYARLGFYNDDYVMLTKLHWLGWEHLAWHYAKHIGKKLTLTHYKTLMSLGGYCKIANISWCKHLVNQLYVFSRRKAGKVLFLHVFHVCIQSPSILINHYGNLNWWKWLHVGSLLLTHIVLS